MHILAFTTAAEPVDAILTASACLALIRVATLRNCSRSCASTFRSARHACEHGRQHTARTARAGDPQRVSGTGVISSVGRNRCGDHRCHVRNGGGCHPQLPLGGKDSYHPKVHYTTDSVAQFL